MAVAKIEALYEYTLVQKFYGMPKHVGSGNCC